MEQKRDLAIILRAVPYQERHKVVTALTEQHGRISALARNSVQSRRFGGTLEPFAASEWQFVERAGAELYRVEEAHIRRSFEGLRKDFQGYALASVFNELMLRLAPEREPAPDLFRLHSNALAALEELPDLAQTGGYMTLLNGYLAKLLQWCGNQPQIGYCLGCQTPIESLESQMAISCIIADAGWVCPSCRAVETRHVVKGIEGESFSHSLLRVTPAALLDFHGSLSAPIRQVPLLALASQEEHKALFRFLEALLVYHVPGFDVGSLKGLRFLDLESNLQPRPGNFRRNQPARV